MTVGQERLEPAGGPLRGSLRVPGDKSVSHRAIMLGALSEGVTEIENFAPGADNRSTVEVFRALGAEIEVDDAARTARVVGQGRAGLTRPDGPLDCGNSGTTMRLAAGLLAGLGIEATLIGDASLSGRPMARIVRPLTQLGAAIEARGEGGTPPVVIGAGGAFRGGYFDSNVASAQVKSSVLLAALAAGKGAQVQEPAPSRDHTEVMLRHWGVVIRSSEHYRYPWRGGRPEVHMDAHPGPLVGRSLVVPGDISSAAFVLVAGAIVPESLVTLEGCGVSTTRLGVLDALKAAGVAVRQSGARWALGGERVADLVVEAKPLKGFTVAAEDVPRLIDEIPILAVLAGRAEGVSVFEGVGELRVKESDRLERTAALMRACGCEVETTDDRLVLTGRPDAPYTAFEFDAQHDHRMAAAAAVASCVADGPCSVAGMDALGVSYPGLLDDLAALRG